MNSEQDWCELETLPHPDQAAYNFTDASVTWGEFISFNVKKNFCDFSVCSEVVRFVFAWEKAKGAKKKFFAFFLRRSSDVCVFPHLLSWKWISLFLQLLSCDKRWAQTLMCFPGQSKTTSAVFFFYENDMLRSQLFSEEKQTGDSRVEDLGLHHPTNLYRKKPLWGRSNIAAVHS